MRRPQVADDGKSAARKHDREDIWTDIGAAADVRVELNVGITGRTEDFGDLVARFAPVDVKSPQHRPRHRTPGVFGPG
jgi:hypothetical protein